MKVLLNESVKNVGRAGEIKEVKDGYARNYLIPHGKAKRATEENLKAFETRRAELEKKQAADLAQAQERGTKLDGQTLKITQKAGVDGRLFGSVTNYDIVAALKTAGHEVERSQIRMPTGALKQVGDYQIQIALHTDVVVTITVQVIGEQ